MTLYYGVRAEEAEWKGRAKNKNKKTKKDKKKEQRKDDYLKRF